MKKILDHPRVVIAVIATITVFFALQLPRVHLDNDVMSFVPEDHPEKVAMDDIHEMFGATVPMSVGIEFPYSTIFTVEAIELIRTLTGQFEAMRYVESVTSMTNTDYIEGSEGGMRVSPLVGEFSGTEEEIRWIKERLLSWDIYDATLYSRDFRSTQILIGLELHIDADEREAVYAAIREILDGHRRAGVRFYLAGDPVIAVLLSTNMRSDVITLIPLVIVVVLTSLFIFFRRAGGVILPMITVLVSSIWTIGAMALLGIPLTMVATVIPVLMIAVGSAYGIHIVNHYYQEIDLHRETIEHDEHREIVMNTLRTVGKPVRLAGITTIIGFGALTTSEVGPMRSFGVFTALGVAVALLVALTLIPALLLVRKHALRGRPPGESSAEATSSNTAFMGLYTFLAHGKARIILLTLGIGAVAIWGASRVVVDNELISYFKEGTEIRTADRFLRRAFGGTRTFNIEVIGDEAGSMTNPEVLHAMDELARHLVRTYPAEIPRVTGYTDFIKRMNQVMHVGEPPPWDAAPPGTPQRTSQGSAPFWWLGTDEFDEGFGDEFGIEFDEDRDGERGGVDRAQLAVPGALPDITDRVDPAEVVRILNRAVHRADRSDLSAKDLLRLLNREINYEGAAYYEIPYNPEHYPAETRAELANLISQYLLIYSGGLNEFSDDDLEPTRARMLVQLSTTGNIFTDRALREVEAFAEQRFPEGYRVRTAGVALVERAISRMISNAQFYSIAVSLSLVFLVLTITFRSLLAGVFGIIPLAFTMLVNFGLMGIAGIKLDVSTAMVASIAIGIGIDYTIHFLSAYHRERRQTDDLAVVERNVLGTTGRAILFNAVSVAAGFAVLLFSAFNPLMFMGLLIALTMFTSSIVAMTVLPVLLAIFNPRFIRKEL